MGLKLWIAERAAKAVALPGVSVAWSVAQFVVRVLGGWRATLWFGGLLWFALQAHWNGALADKLQAERDAAAQHAELAAAQLATAQAAVTVREVTKYVDRVRVVQGRTHTIIREVPHYVPSDAPSLPGGFRLLHDAAAQGVLPDPAGLADAAPVPAQDAAGTVADNYGTCHETAEQLTALQSWIRAQQTVAK